MSTLLFVKHELRSVLSAQNKTIRDEVDACPEDYLLQVSENEHVDHLISKFTVHPPKLGEPFRLEPEEVDIDVSRNPMFGVGIGQRPYAKGCRVVIHIPFVGETELFFCRPPTSTTDPPRAEIRQDHLEIAYECIGELNTDEFKRHYERVLAQIRYYLDNIEIECNGFNTPLEGHIRLLVATRKARLLKNRNLAAMIDLPVQRRNDAPKTYTVPDVRRRPQLKLPILKEKAFISEPALAEQEYETILGILRSMVRVMEYSPKAFAQMNEEDIRMQFLVQLNGQYQERATGETFNNQGKTDILIREGDRNAFIAECKIWKGEAELLRAIDQILSYLHWRDTKAALLVFNQNKSLSAVLAKLRAVVESHTCCKRLYVQTGETEWRFVFHNPGDANRELHLTVMVFDVPRNTA